MADGTPSWPLVFGILCGTIVAVIMVAVIMVAFCCWWAIIWSWLHSWLHQQLEERRPAVQDVGNESRSSDVSSFRQLSLRIERGRV